MVISCFFGKDRTGVLAALVLDALGVRHEEIISDYAASAPGVAALLTHMRRDPVYAETIDLTPPHVLSATAATMTDFLSELDHRHGGGRQWLLSAGITPTQLRRLADHLVREGVQPPAAPTIGSFNGVPPAEPSKVASPKVNTPPSEAINQ
jgi:protein-tyrosine phosphatase